MDPNIDTFWVQKGTLFGHFWGPTRCLARAEIHGYSLLESAGDRGFSFRPKKVIPQPNALFSGFGPFLDHFWPKKGHFPDNTSLLGVLPWRVVLRGFLRGFKPVVDDLGLGVGPKCVILGVKTPENHGFWVDRVDRLDRSIC